jgi:hypothetical protein
MKSKSNDEKIATEKLLKSKALAGYQQDFAKAILTKPEYTIEEAIATLDKTFKKGDTK